MRTLVTVKGGKITMDVIEGHGEECVRATEDYIDRLAASQAWPMKHQFKPEYHESDGPREREQAHE